MHCDFFMKSCEIMSFNANSRQILFMRTVRQADNPLLLNVIKMGHFWEVFLRLP
jgi:hypothetical protein